MTLTALIAQRDELITKIAKGERRLQAGDTSIEFFDVPSLQRSLAVVDAEIAKIEAAAAGRSNGRIGRLYGREGL